MTEPTTHLTADPSDHDLEWDPDLQRPVAELLADEGWSLESQGPGTYVLVCQVGPRREVMACPLVVNSPDNVEDDRYGNGDDVQWYVATDSADGHTTEHYEYLPVTTPPAEVAAFLRGYLTRHGLAPQA